MAKSKYTWAPAKAKAASKIPDAVKSEVEFKANEIIERVLKPKYIEAPSEKTDLNYLSDISCKWYRGYFYFTSKYTCPSPYATAPSFNSNFARLEYISKNRFNLAYMRHTGQWFEIGFDLSIEACLDEIENGPHFMP